MVQIPLLKDWPQRSINCIPLYLPTQKGNPAFHMKRSTDCTVYNSPIHEFALNPVCTKSVVTCKGSAFKQVTCIGDNAQEKL